MSKNLPVITQSIVYRTNDQQPEVLLLKRSKERGDFWSVVNGTLELDESVNDCRKRELFEETGIKDVLDWSEEINRFSFEYQDYTIVVLVYVAKVKEDQKVIINNEHTEYKWLKFSEAIKMVKFDDDKNGLQICLQRLAGNDL